MATEILNKYSPHDIIPTSEARSIKANTDRDKVSVRIYDDAGDPTEPIYTTTLYAFDGRVELADVGTLVEDYLRATRKSMADITVQLGHANAWDSATARFLYCENICHDCLPEDSLLLASSVQRVFHNSNVTFAAFIDDNEPALVLSAVGPSKTDGTDSVLTWSVDLPASDGVVVRYFDVPSIINRAVNQSPDNVALARVRHFSIKYGSLQKLCFIVPDLPHLSFSFRNGFNVEEFIDVHGTVKTKTEVSRSSAVCRGRRSQYDKSVERTYQFTTGLLSNDEAAVFEQFLASHDITLWLDGDDYQVIITDHSCEHSTDDDQITSISFTWQFVEKRPHIFNADIFGILPDAGQIFTHEFSNEYE